MALTEQQTELKTFFVQNGYIAEAEFDEAAKVAEAAGADLYDILIEKGYFTEEYLASALGEFYRVPYVNLKKVTIPQDVLTALPEEMARQYKAIVFGKEDDVYHVAMESPQDLRTLQLIERTIGREVKPHIATRTDIRDALVLYKRTFGEEFAKIVQENVEQAMRLKGDISEVARDVPIVRLMDTILEYAVSGRASDVHIEHLGDRVLVRFRVDGILRDIISLPVFMHAPLVARVKVLSNLKLDEHFTPQDGRFKFKVGDINVSARVSVLPTFHGEKAVLRILEESARFLTLEELGMTGEQAEIIKESIAKTYGMVLVTGPTGSGKTTTLYTVMHLRNTPDVNIQTIEDPIEYEMKRINQVQVNEQTGMVFAEGLRSILRQDPNIIMVGEIRDAETAELAVHAALTGHLVLSTLHTNNAAGAAPRLLDMKVEPFLLASTLILSLAQRLVRRICRDCITSKNLTPEEFEAVKRQIIAIDARFSARMPVGDTVFFGQGCAACGHSGYRGRIAIFEFFTVTSKIRELIVRRASLDELMRQAIADGMKTMFEDGLEKVASGITTIEEVLRVIRE